MNSAPETKGLWWKKIAFGLEVYMVFATIAMFVLSESSGAINLGVDHRPALICLLAGSVVSCFALIATGVILIIRRQPKLGWIALAFAGYAFFFFLLCLPALASQRF
jgi:nitrate reductase gamma subunit